MGLLFIVLPISSSEAWGEQALVAVAANFSGAMERLKPDFEAASGHQLSVSVGSTGKLFAQIKNGAPYDLLLAADQHRPSLLEAEGLAVQGTRFTYALGRLALWSADRDRIGGAQEVALSDGSFRRLAIANPELAPYGLAARETLESLGRWQALEGRIVMGENVAQAYAFVASGNAELGFVALSSILSPRNRYAGSRWDVPAHLHSPIRQDAVLLARAAANRAARQFLAFLESKQAQATIQTLGYGIEGR